MWPFHGQLLGAFVFHEVNDLADSHWGIPNITPCFDFHGTTSHNHWTIIIIIINDGTKLNVSP